MMGDYFFTVADNRPTLSNHHANPDPGLVAVLRARLSHRRGQWLLLMGYYTTPVMCVSFFPLLYLVIQRDLLGIQRLLNSTEFSLHQLTALLDCRGLHKVRSDS